MDLLPHLLHDPIGMAKDLVFLHCQHAPRCDAVVDKRFDYHTLQLMTRGRVELRYGARREVVGPAAAWPAYPGPRIRFGAAAAGGWWAHRYAAFHGPRVRRWREQGLLLQRPVRLRAPRAAELARMMDEMIVLAGGSRPLDTLRAGNLLEAILLRLAELAAREAAEEGSGRGGVGPNAPGDWLPLVLARLEDLSEPDPDYARLAAEHAMALSTLRRRFRQAVHTPLHTYRLAQKIVEARRLLVDTRLTLQDIADRLGYRDVYYFSRQFDTAVGVPPGRYRRSRQGDHPPGLHPDQPRPTPTPPAIDAYNQLTKPHSR